MSNTYITDSKRQSLPTSVLLMCSLSSAEKEMMLSVVLLTPYFEQLRSMLSVKQDQVLLTLTLEQLHLRDHL